MKLISMAMLILNLFVSTAWGYKAGQFAPKVPDMMGCPGIPCSCSCTDPYDPRVKSIAGSNVGQCLDTCSFRNAILLSSSDEKTLTLANVVLNDEFYVAKIPVNKIKETIFQIEWFGVWPSNHFQIRFVFDEDVVLTPQDTSSDSSVAYERDFVWTVMGMGPVNQIYGLEQALNGDVINSFVFAAMSDYVNHAVIKQGHVVEQYAVKLSKPESSRLLEALLQKGNSDAYQIVYNFGERSCVQEFFKVFDGILSDKNKIKSQKILSQPQNIITRTVPSEVIHYSKALGIFLYQKPDVHKEFQIKI